jgi:hypothetical protein
MFAAEPEAPACCVAHTASCTSRLLACRVTAGCAPPAALTRLPFPVPVAAAVTADPPSADVPVLGGVSLS